MSDIVIGDTSYTFDDESINNLSKIIPFIKNDIHEGIVTIKVVGLLDEETLSCMIALGHDSFYIKTYHDYKYLLELLKTTYEDITSLKSFCLTFIKTLEYFAVDILECGLHYTISLIVNILNEKLQGKSELDHVYSNINILNIEYYDFGKLYNYLYEQLSSIRKRKFTDEDFYLQVLNLVMHDICHLQSFHLTDPNYFDYINLYMDDFHEKLEVYKDEGWFGATIHPKLSTKYIPNLSCNIDYIQVHNNEVTITYYIENIFNSHKDIDILEGDVLQIKDPNGKVLKLPKIEGIDISHLHSKDSNYINIYNRKIDESRVIKYNRIIGNKQLYDIMVFPTLSQIAYILEYVLYVGDVGYLNR